jgi:hypothetical protein
MKKSKEATGESMPNCKSYYDEVREELYYTNDPRGLSTREVDEIEKKLEELKKSDTDDN